MLKHYIRYKGMPEQIIDFMIRFNLYDINKPKKYSLRYIDISEDKYEIYIPVSGLYKIHEEHIIVPHDIKQFTQQELGEIKNPFYNLKRTIFKDITIYFNIMDVWNSNNNSICLFDTMLSDETLDKILYYWGDNIIHIDSNAENEWYSQYLINELSSVGVSVFELPHT